MNSWMDDRRRRRASRVAVRGDVAWFRANPKRLWRVRPFMPNEMATTADNNITISYRDILDRSVSRIAMKGDLEKVADNDRFLGGLWFYIEQQRQPGKPVDIAPEAHLMLLTASGDARAT